MSDLIHELFVIRSADYLSMALATAVAYDQLLNFSQEVDLIWNRRWSIVTLLYLLARYCGSLSVIGGMESSTGIGWTTARLEAALLVVDWSSNIFVIAMQGILLMRVYALWNRSKRVLVFLVVCFFCQVIAVVVMAGLDDNMHVMRKFVVYVGPTIGEIAQVIDLDEDVFSPPPVIGGALQLAFDAMLFVFALVAFIRHTWESRKTAGGWSVNRLVKILVQDQMFYFSAFAVWMAVGIPITTLETDIASNVIGAIVVVAGPRMVISLRAQELKLTAGTFEEDLSTIQFGARDPPAATQTDAEEEGPEEGHTRRRALFEPESVEFC